MARVHNFGAGPAALPLPVLQKAQVELLDFAGSGMSVMELSHRSKTFDAVLKAAEANVKRLLNVPDDYSILFLQGGASLQFAMLPMNLLGAGQTADYVHSGAWAEKAIKEAKLLGKVNQCGAVKPRFAIKKAEWSEWEQKYLPGAAFGMFVVSTPQGLMTHDEAREKGLGGRLIAYIY